MDFDFSVLNFVSLDHRVYVFEGLRFFCDKHGFLVYDFDYFFIGLGVIFFDDEYGFLLSDIFLDIEFSVPKGFAYSYMLGIDLDEGFIIDRELSYRDYLVLKGLI